MGTPDGAGTQNTRKSPHLIGEHLIYTEQPDVVHLKIRGVVDESQPAQMLAWASSAMKDVKCFYMLIDINELSGVGPGVGSSTSRIEPIPQERHSFFYGGSFRQRVLAKLAATAMWLLAKGKERLHAPRVVETEKEARELIRKLRENDKEKA